MTHGHMNIKNSSKQEVVCEITGKNPNTSDIRQRRSTV